jgi:hypothetical protein
MLVLEGEDAELFARLQEKNLARQYDLLTAFVEIGLKQGPTALDKYALWALNHVAVAGISQFGGRFREQPIYVGNHIPPHFKEVPHLMDQFISFIHENWFVLSSTELAAYGLWPMAAELGASIYRGQWSNSPGDLLLSFVRPRRAFAPWAENSAGADPRKSASICRSTARR